METRCRGSWLVGPPQAYKVREIAGASGEVVGFNPRGMGIVKVSRNEQLRQLDDTRCDNIQQ